MNVCIIIDCCYFDKDRIVDAINKSILSTFKNNKDMVYWLLFQNIAIIQNTITVWLKANIKIIFFSWDIKNKS